MDAKYFKERICDELDGAKHYAKKAIEIKPMNLEWSRMLIEMSSAELKHAEYLYKMFGEYYKKISEAYTTVPSYITDIREEIVDMYTECGAKVKAIHEMYNH